MFYDTIAQEEVYGVFLCSPTNSTMFTECCDVTICSYERRCPVCNALIYGHEATSDHERGTMRWKMVYKSRR